jgi:positive phototaxis protein PixI
VIILSGTMPFDLNLNQKRRSRRDPLRGAPTERNQMLGLVVTEVRDITWCETDQIQSPPAASINSELAPYVRGVWVNPDEDMYVALDGQAIVNRLLSHRS